MELALIKPLAGRGDLDLDRSFLLIGEFLAARELRSTRDNNAYAP